MAVTDYCPYCQRMLGDHRESCPLYRPQIMTWTTVPTCLGVPMGNEIAPYRAAMERLSRAKEWIDHDEEDWDGFAERYATEQVLYALTHLDPTDMANCYHIVHEVVAYMILFRDDRDKYIEYFAQLVEAFTNLREGRGATQGPSPPPTPEPYTGFENDSAILDAWIRKKPEEGR